jgi:hypothetical protein
MLAEAMQVNTIVESSECIRLLHLTRKRLLKSSPKSYERAVKLLVNHHFMQNILNILEQCPIHADEVRRWLVLLFDCIAWRDSALLPWLLYIV